MLQSQIKVTSTRFHEAMYGRRLRHWSTASSIVVTETRESVVGYHATCVSGVRCPSTV